MDIYSFLILSSSFFINLIVSYLIRNQVKVLYGRRGFYFHLCIYHRYLSCPSNFSLCTGIVYSQKRFLFWYIRNGIVLALSSVLSYLSLATIENKTLGWGSGMHFFHFPYLNEGTAGRADHYVHFTPTILIFLRLHHF